MSAAAAVLRNCRRVSDGRLEKGIESALASQVAAQLSFHIWQLCKFDSSRKFEDQEKEKINKCICQQRLRIQLPVTCF